MTEISNATMTECQSCGDWTNFASQEHYKVLVAEHAQLMRALMDVLSMIESGKFKSMEPLSRGQWKATVQDARTVLDGAKRAAGWAN